MQSTFLVFLGAGIGGSLRHLVNLGCLRACGPAFPVGTMLINIVGSLLMGVKFRGDTAETETLVMRSKTGTVRRIKSSFRNVAQRYG